MAKCYMCNNESTSVEHAPPKCFFPIKNRKNLITVPACQTHNLDTSKDDEYVRNIITTSINNNQTSVNHFFDKTLRSYQRSPGLLKEVLDSLQEVSQYEPGAKAFQFNRKRFDRTIRKIAYAIFYYEYGFTWERLLAVATNQIKMPDMTNDHLGEIFESLSNLLSGLVFKGENPLVFQYACIDFGNNQHDKAIFMMFYEGFAIWVIPDKSSNNNSFD